MLIQRDLLDRIVPVLDRREFISIVGPRQSGKTTFLSILKDHLHNTMGVREELIHFVTFEDRRLLFEFENDPVAFVRSFVPGSAEDRVYLFIDEFQYAVDGGQKLKLVYDTVPGIKAVITGSSSLDIKARVGKFVVGRILDFNLYPFNFGEFLRAQDQRLERRYQEKHSELNRYICHETTANVESGPDIMYEEMIQKYEAYTIWGGYPAVVLCQTENERRKLLADTYNNYILKDVKTLVELATERKLFLLSQHLAAQVGNVVSF